jgi:hypothetical protein
MALSQLGWPNIEVWDRLSAPKPSQNKFWGQEARSYGIGLTETGQRVLEDIGALDRVLKCCTPLLKRWEWSPQAPEGKRLGETSKAGSRATQVFLGLLTQRVKSIVARFLMRSKRVQGELAC